MQIHLADFGKKYNREWIFKGISKTISSNSTTAIVGSNGSGKSTLLKLISGAEISSEGSLTYEDINGNLIPLEKAYKHIHLIAPYTDLPELLSLEELYQFHKRFHPIDKSLEEFTELLFLNGNLKKQIRNFSSGMKQRLKLGLAFWGQQPCLLLDEPCSNLDQQGIDLFNRLVQEFKGKKTLIIGSNQDKNEIAQADEILNLMNYKN